VHCRCIPEGQSCWGWFLAEDVLSNSCLSGGNVEQYGGFGVQTTYIPCPGGEGGHILGPTNNPALLREAANTICATTIIPPFYITAALPYLTPKGNSHEVHDLAGDGGGTSNDEADTPSH